MQMVHVLFHGVLQLTKISWAPQRRDLFFKVSLDFGAIRNANNLYLHTIGCGSYARHQLIDHPLTQNYGRRSESSNVVMFTFGLA